MEAELRFQGSPPPPLYELSLVKLKTKGLVRSEAPELDIWAWSDTPALNDLRHETMVQSGLMPYQTTLLSGLNSPKEATYQSGSQSGLLVQRDPKS